MSSPNVPISTPTLEAPAAQETGHASRHVARGRRGAWATLQTICLVAVLAPLTSAQEDLPDLIVDQERLVLSEPELRLVDEADCAFQEGCFGGTGWRTLVKFDTQTANIGTADVRFGPPQGNPLFVFDTCHGHYHFGAYAEYRVLDFFGEEVTDGGKTGFCLLDSVRYVDDTDTPMNPTYTCSNQGLSRGWSDIYGESLDCQWVDVTDLDDGVYRLVVEVNPEQVIEESDYTNNAASAVFQIGNNGVPLLPDGGLVDTGEPMRVARSINGRDIDVFWDTEHCAESNLTINAFWGRSFDLPSYEPTAPICDLGSSGSATLSIPLPPPNDYIWFVLGTQAGSLEGGYGFDSNQSLRSFDTIGNCGIGGRVPQLGCVTDFPEF